VQNSASENRKTRRLNLQTPIRIKGKESSNVDWEEITYLNDVSALGACFNLKRRVESGNLLNLTLPMPNQFRYYDHYAPQYYIWGLIRHVVFKPDSETFSVGVAFIGKRPPSSYEMNPQTFYQLTNTLESGFWCLSEKNELSSNEKESSFKKDQRKLERHKIPLNIFLETLDQQGQIHSGEPSVTEDISTDGACVLTSLSFKEGDFVRFTCQQFNVSILSIISRIHLEFIDQKFPMDKM
jgi:hypothetical protein